MDRSDRKTKIISVVVAVAMITFVSILSGCIEERVYEEQSVPDVKKIEEYDYVSFEELYGSIPANLTDQRAWSQWESEYKGKRIIGKGRLDAIEILPEKGLFLILSMPREDIYTESDVTKIVFSVEDAYKILLGEEEGTFFINGIKRICLGDSYTFSGRVSNFTSFDMDLVYDGYGGLILVEGRATELQE